MNKTAIDVYRTLAIPQALGVGPPGLDILLDNTELQLDPDFASALSITHTCSTSQQQLCKPYEDEGLLTLIFIDQPAGLQVSNECLSSPNAPSTAHTQQLKAQVLVEILGWLIVMFLCHQPERIVLPLLLLSMLACCLPLSEVLQLQVCEPTDIVINIPGGHVAVLPGYTLEHATCGLFKACKYRLVSLFPSVFCIWSAYQAQESADFAISQLCVYQSNHNWMMWK